MQDMDVRSLIVIFLIFLQGCVSSPQANLLNNDNQLDLYLSTMDDKHFVWCELDLEQCRKDFEIWKRTPRGQSILAEYEKKDMGQTYNTHNVPNVFRTRFVDESHVNGEIKGYDSGHSSHVRDESSLLPNLYEHVSQELISAPSRRLGPEVPSQYPKLIEGPISSR